MPRGRPIKRKAGNNAGSVYYVKSKKLWAWQVSVAGRRKTGYAHAHDEAEKARTEALYLNSKGLLTTEDPQLSEWSERWLEEKATKANVGQLKNSTLDSYRRKIGTINRFVGTVKLSKLRPDQLENTYQELLRDGLSPGYVNAVHRSVGDCLRTAFRRGLMPRDVVAMTDAPSAPKSNPYILSRKEWNSLILASRQETNGILVEVVLKTGMRVDVEALSLAWPQIDFDKGTITVGKTKTEAGTGRMIPLDASLIQLLRTRHVEHAETKMASGGKWNPNSLVFCTRAGDRPSLTNIRRRAFRRIKQRGGVPEALTFRDLRHNCGSYLLSEGVPITVVSNILGHANPSITMSVYAHELKEDAEQVRDAMSRVAG